MKKKIKAGTAILGGIMLLSALPVQAAGNNYTGVAGQKTKFDTYLVMGKSANVPNASFTYQIAPGVAKNYNINGKKFEVLSGVGTPVISDEDKKTEGSQVIFTTGDATYQSKQTGDQVKAFDETTQKYAKKEAEIDFTGCRFTEPGIYRYVLTETGTNQGIRNDEQSQRYLDVYVTDNGTGLQGLQVESYVLHANATDIGAGTEAGSDGQVTDSKSQGYTNFYTTGNLTFKEAVSGNQASRDKYFAYTVEITNAKGGTVYQVDLSKADQVSGSNVATIQKNQNQTNPSTLTVPEGQTSVSGTFYLQNNQEITVLGLAEDTGYQVSAEAEDYKLSAGGVSGYGDETAGTIQTTRRAGGNEVKTSYLHTRNGMIPTGVALKILPYAGMMLVGIAGVLGFAVKKGRRYGK